MNISEHDNKEIKSLLNALYGEFTDNKFKIKLLISELIELILTTPIDDTPKFKSLIIKKVRGIENEIKKLGC